MPVWSETTIEEAIAFVEGREYLPDQKRSLKVKRDITSKYDYKYKNNRIKNYWMK